MIKKIIVILGALMILTVVWMGYTSIKKLTKKETVQERQSDLSEMLNQLGQKKLDSKSYTILIFFNSECETCQWEMEEIGKNIDQFGQHQLLLTSFEPEYEAINFLNQHNLSNYYVKSTPEKVMASYTGGVPQTFIYQDGTLVKHFKGEVRIEAILEALEGR